MKKTRLMGPAGPAPSGHGAAVDDPHEQLPPVPNEHLARQSL